MSIVPPKSFSTRRRLLTVQYRKLGSSDLIVSEIALGSWLTYSGGVDKDRSIACSNGPRPWHHVA